MRQTVLHINMESVHSNSEERCHFYPQSRFLSMFLQYGFCPPVANLCQIFRSLGTVQGSRGYIFFFWLFCFPCSLFLGYFFFFFKILQGCQKDEVLRIVPGTQLRAQRVLAIVLLCFFYYDIPHLSPNMNMLKYTKTSLVLFCLFISTKI